MESLALAAAVIVLVIIVTGVGAAVAAWRNPRRPWSRSVGAVVGALAAGAGGWLALLDVGTGARAVGAVVAVTGVVAVARSVRRG